MSGIESQVWTFTGLAGHLGTAVSSDWQVFDVGGQRSLVGSSADVFFSFLTSFDLQRGIVFPLSVKRKESSISSGVGTLFRRYQRHHLFGSDKLL